MDLEMHVDITVYIQLQHKTVLVVNILNSLEKILHAYVIIVQVQSMVDNCSQSCEVYI